MGHSPSANELSRTRPGDNSHNPSPFHTHTKATCSGCCYLTCEDRGKARCFGCCECRKPQECLGCCQCGPPPTEPSIGLSPHAARTNNWKLEDRVWMREVGPFREYGVGIDRLDLFFRCSGSRADVVQACKGAARALGVHRWNNRCDCDWAHLNGCEIEATSIFRIQLNCQGQMLLLKNRSADEAKNLCIRSASKGRVVREMVDRHDAVCACGCFGKAEEKRAECHATEKESTQPDKHYQQQPNDAAAHPFPEANRCSPGRFKDGEYNPPADPTSTPLLNALNQRAETDLRAREPCPEEDPARQEWEHQHPQLAALERQSQDAAAAAPSREMEAMHRGFEQLTIHNMQDGRGEQREPRHRSSASHGGRDRPSAPRTGRPSASTRTTWDGGFAPRARRRREPPPDDYEEDFIWL